MTLRWLNRLLYGLWHVSPICCPVISPTNSGNIQHPFLWSQWNVDTPNKKTWFLRVFLQNWTEGNGFKTIVHPNDCSQPPSTYWCCPWTVSHHQKAFSPWWMPNLGTGRWVPLPMMEHTKLPWWDNPPESILHLRNSKRYISIHVHSSYIFQKKNVSCNVSYKGHCSSRRVDYPPHCSQFPWSASARHTACISKSQWLASHRWDYWGHLGSRDSRCHWLQPRCLGIFWGRNLVNAIFKA
jgi:hypothetical protein